MQDYRVPTPGSDVLRREAAENLGHLVDGAAADGDAEVPEGGSRVRCDSGPAYSACAFSLVPRPLLTSDLHLVRATSSVSLGRRDPDYRLPVPRKAMLGVVPAGFHPREGGCDT